MKARLCYLGLGSNLGDRLAYLGQGLALLKAVPGVQLDRVSAVYESPAVGYQSANLFLNAVVEMHCLLGSMDLLQACLVTERACGRQRALPSSFADADQPGYTDRTLDVDLLWFEGAGNHGALLALPHPEAHHRAFVLKPWCELAPALVLQERPLSHWLAQCPAVEASAVTLYADSAHLLAAAGVH